MFEPINARFASSFSKNGINEAATLTSWLGETSIWVISSAGVLTTFTLDTVVPTFNVTFVDNDTSTVTDIDTETLNFVEKQTIGVTNAANDIARFSVSSSGDNYVTGDREDLQEFLRNLNVDAAYVIKVQDEAGNVSQLSFTLNQQFHALHEAIEPK